jgi:hypothetical protein
MKLVPTGLSYAVLCLAAVVAGCGSGSPLKAGDDDGGGAGGASGATGRVPTTHRPTAAACPVIRPSSMTTCPFAGQGRGDCTADSDCKAGADGKCSGMSLGTCSCTYDACFSDSDCTMGSVCACSGTYSGNTCVASNCKIDADCGVNGFCSPEIEHCTGALLGYFCRTPKDKCTDDADCGDAAHCARDSGTGVWGCQSTDGCPL